MTQPKDNQWENYHENLRIKVNKFLRQEKILQFMMYLIIKRGFV
jgi:hypothetical protein